MLSYDLRKVVTDGRLDQERLDMYPRVSDACLHDSKN